MRQLSIVLFLWIAQVSLVSAEAIRQPSLLAPGDGYRLAFVTSTTTTAESADIEFYNRFVQATADAAPLGGWGLEWKAIGSTETVSARENTSTDTDDTSVPIFLLDGTELVPSYTSLWNAEVDVLFRPFDVNEFGVAFNSLDPPILTVWTGTQADGFPSFLTGQNEGGPLGAGAHSTTGVGDLGSNLWMNATNRPNRSATRMYALSEVVTAVPEPNDSFHLFVLLALLSTLQMRKSTNDLHLA